MKTYQKTDRIWIWIRMGGRSGAILGMVLIIVVALSMIGLGVLHLCDLNAVEVSRGYNNNRAFWAAEAGLASATARLRGESGYREGSFPSTFQNPNWGYSVCVLSPDHVNFGISSTGTVLGATRIVQQALQINESWPNAFNYSLYSGESMKLAKDISITGDGTYGDVYANEGFAGGSKEPITNNCSLYDGVSGGYPAPSPVPTVPPLDTTYYNGLLAQAVTSPHTTYPASLGGGFYYVNQGVVISSGVSGPGTLVVNGTVSISSSTASIGDNITIIALGGLSIGSTSLLGSNDVFYSASGISVAKDSNFSQGHSALVTPGNIDIQKEFVFSGLIFAGGDITLDKASGSLATITGCVVSGGQMVIKKDFNVVYDRTQLPDTVMSGFTPEVVVSKAVWHEVFQ